MMFAGHAFRVTPKKEFELMVPKKPVQRYILRQRFIISANIFEFVNLMNVVREAARRGESGVAVLTFPAALGTDGGRAINLPDPDWPASLRGKAADFFLHWDKELRPLGFALSARIVSFPDGFPGDVELSLVWGR
jgi:hypothetical protein